MKTVTVLVHYEREVKIELTDAEYAVLQKGEGPGYDAVDERITATADDPGCPDGLHWLGTTVQDANGEELWSVS